MNNVLRFFSGSSRCADYGSAHPIDIVWCRSDALCPSSQLVRYSDAEWPTAQLAFPQILCAQLKLGHWEHVDDDGEGGGHHEWVWHNKYAARAPP